MLTQALRENQDTEPRSLLLQNLHGVGETGPYHCLHFKEDGIKAQRGYMTCPRSHSWQVAEPGFEPRQRGFSVLTLPATLTLSHLSPLPPESYSSLLQL